MGLPEPGRERQSGQGVALAPLCLGLPAAGRGEGPHPDQLIHAAFPYEALVGAGPARKQGLGPGDVPGHRLPCCGVKAGGTPMHTSPWEMLAWRLVSSSPAALMLRVYKLRCASSVTAGTGPACVQCPHNPVLLQVEEGGGLGRCPCASA